MVRRVPSKHRNAPVRIEKDKNAFFRLGLLLIVGLVLACGFVYAGRQHFVALKYGYETETLRRERDQLAEEERRLILQREAASSPVRLEQAAKRLGMQPLQPAQVDPLRQGGNYAPREAAPTLRAQEKPAKRETGNKAGKAAASAAAKSTRKPI